MAEINVNVGGNTVQVNVEVKPASLPGPKGDPFEYEDFTPEQLEGLRGPQGIQGEKGDTGERGPQGVQGIQGERGPQGVQGIQGERGAAFTYNDFTDSQLEALRGPKGETGMTGPKGAKGDKGDKGDTGARGPQGVQGNTGPQGDDGKSAYQVALDNGFEGTETEWLESLKGESDEIFVVYLSSVSNHNCTVAEIRDAVNAGKVVILRDHNGMIFNYVGEYEREGVLCPMFEIYYHGDIGLARTYINIYADYKCEYITDPLVKTPSQWPLTFTGAASNKYDGSAAVAVNIPEGGAGIAVDSASVGQMVVVKEIDENGKPTAWEAVDVPDDESVFYVTVRTVESVGDYGQTVYTQVSDKTYAEIEEAYDKGSTIICRRIWGRMENDMGYHTYYPLTQAYTEEAYPSHNLFRFEGFIDNYAAFTTYNYECIEILVSGSVRVNDYNIVFEDDIAQGIPNPKALRIRKDYLDTGVKVSVAEYDGSERVDVDIDELLTWNDIKNNPFTSGFVEILAETTYTVPEGEEVNDTMLPIAEHVSYPTLGGSYVVTYNGVEYVCPAQEMNEDGKSLLMLGNLSSFGMAGNDEPFLMVLILNDEQFELMGRVYGMVQPLDGSTTFTLSVRSGGFVLEEKSLPAIARPAVFYIGNIDANKTNYLYKSAESATNKTESDRVTYNDLSAAVKANRRIVIRYIHGDSINPGESFFYPVAVTVTDDGFGQVTIYYTLTETYRTFYTAEYTGT